MKNYYEILEVNQKASREVIEKAYKVLIRKYHPDLYSGEKKIYAEKKSKEIIEAYNVLTDEFLREQYDSELEKEEMDMFTKKFQMDENSIENNTRNRQNRTNSTRFRNKNVQQETDNTQEVKRYKVGSFMGLVDLTRGLFKNRPIKKGPRKKMTQKDWLAIGLTAIATIILGIILWFLPFTNGWMRELLFENPLFSWIGALFN